MPASQLHHYTFCVCGYQLKDAMLAAVEAERKPDPNNFPWRVEIVCPECGHRAIFKLGWEITSADDLNVIVSLPGRRPDDDPPGGDAWVAGQYVGL